MLRRLVASLLAAGLSVACSGGTPSEPDGGGGIRDAPASITLYGQTLVLETHLWRDFQQISPPGGRGLAAVVRVKTLDGTEYPAKVQADTVWVFNGDDSWTPVFEVVAGSGGSWLELAMRNGPKWGPGIAVDVVVRLRDAFGAPHLLQARSQPIVRTD